MVICPRVLALSKKSIVAAKKCLISSNLSSFSGIPPNNVKKPISFSDRLLQFDVKCPLSIVRLAHEQQRKPIESNRTKAVENISVFEKIREEEEAQLVAKTTGQKVARAATDFTYVIIIGSAVAVTGLLFYIVFHELYGNDSPTHVFSVTLKMVKNNQQAVDLLGEPIMGYGEMTSRKRRRHVQSMDWRDKNGKKHLRVLFHVKGNMAKGEVLVEMIEFEAELAMIRLWSKFDNRATVACPKVALLKRQDSMVLPVEDGFILVTRKHKRCSKRPSTESNVTLLGNDVAVSQEKISYMFTKGMEKLKQSDFLSSTLHQTSKSLQNANVSCFVCYGLGTFSLCSTSLYQLCLLFHLKTKFHPKETIVFDPQFTSGEKSWLTERGLTVPDRNDQGLFSVRDPDYGRTLVFMPHCGRPLINNIIRANFNWKHLSNLIIIGNSLKIMYIPEKYSNDLECLVKVRNVCKERKLVNFGPCEYAFNDLAVMKFCDLPQPVSDFWKVTVQKPNYEHFADEIIIE